VTVWDTLGHMPTTARSVQRSFRLSARTLELLDAAAADGSESRNALVDRLLGEAVRVERHPLIRFHRGASGRRRPLVVGTRLYVHQIVSTLKGNGGDVAETAEYFALDEPLVRAALDYYVEFSGEVDDDADDADREAAAERSRWERRQQALG
jgi:uncharacterized protein (DUF433 family)